MEGSGAKAAVLLHGIGVDHRVWQATGHRLGGEFRLYMPDLRGHGASDKPKRGYGLADYASDIEQFIEALDIGCVTLVGSSLGGMVALTVEAAPSAVDGLVLVDPPLRRGMGPQRPLFERILEIKSSNHPDQTKYEEMRAVLAEFNPSSGQIYLNYMSASWMNCATAVIAEALSPIETFDEIKAALSRLTVPVLIMRADPARGGVLREDDATTAVELLQCGSLRYYPGASHAIHASQPVKFASDLLEFAQHTEESHAR
jgi:pimeloyl-ACP methyl ester carboxylesterase